MDLIEEFKIHYDKDVCDYVFTVFMAKNMFDVFMNACQDPSNDYECLFKLALEHGLYDVIYFLYIHKNCSYDYDILTNDKCVIINNSDNSDTNDKIITGNYNDGLRFSLDDKYSFDKLQCINFLLDMKKYSTIIRDGAKHKYKFNKKYINQI